MNQPSELKVYRRKKTLATATFNPENRGYVIQYRPGIACPGCGRSHWYVGRGLAECAFCTTALPL